jgi:NAD(P)-dependent dehydrogenase (short-subunit alcohol dehydrogenase family)
MLLDPGNTNSLVGRLNGKRVIVTGAARGIGAEIAGCFASEGARLALIDVIEDELHEVAARVGAASIVGDLRNPEAAQLATMAAIEALGGVDVLVNNAGILRFCSILDMSADDWDCTFEINARAILFTTQVVVRRMIEQRSTVESSGVVDQKGTLEHRGTVYPRRTTNLGGRESLCAGKIVNMASMGAKLGAPNQAHYCASKAAVVAFTRVSAMEFGPYGINVNCICPGFVMTEMGAATRTPEMVAAWASNSPLGRLAEPSDVARTALFLASSDSDYCTGQAMNVSGGMVMH